MPQVDGNTVGGKIMATQVINYIVCKYPDVERIDILDDQNTVLRSFDFTQAEEACDKVRVVTTSTVVPQAEVEFIAAKTEPLLNVGPLIEGLLRKIAADESKTYEQVLQECRDAMPVS